MCIRDSEKIVLMSAFLFLTILPLGFGVINDFQFLLAPGLIGCTMFYLLGDKGHIEIKMSVLEYLWIPFILIAFASYFWADDKGSVLQSSFGWLVMLLTLLLLRILRFELMAYEILGGVGLFLLIGLVLLHIYVITEVGNPAGTQWHDFFGKNGNYTSAYLVGLYPFLLFKDLKSRTNFAIKVVVGFFVGYVLMLTTAKASAMAFLVLVGLWFFKKLGKIRRKHGLITISSVVFVLSLIHI